MARHWITLGDVAARIDTLEIRCGRCDRHGRLNVARLLAEHGPDAKMRDVMRAQVGDCPKRDDADPEPLRSLQP
jgi:hypothetical protein